MFAPMPPARTGVAEYAAELYRALRSGGRVELGPPRADVNLYHIGNNGLHAEIYRRALERPGIVVLHDAVLHHFALGCFDREAYISEFAYNYGEWMRGFAGELWAERARSAADPRYFRYPMLRRIVERSTAVIVHNPGAARIVREHVPAAKVFEIPHLFTEQPAPAYADVLRVRQRLGVGADEFLCGIFGHLRESKRIESVVRACGRAKVRLLIAGDCPPALERALDPALREPFVVRAPYASMAEFCLLTHAVDVCANLRYPAAGETSGIAIRLMGVGKPVIMTEGTETSHYPRDISVHVPAALGEVDAVAETLLWLSGRRGHARSIGARAAEYIRREHGPAKVAALYWQVLQQ